jgi:carboxypeptidase C (cathepsin A)
MKRTTQVQAALTLAGALVLPAHAVDNMSKDAYKAAEKERISATYKADRARCDTLTGNAKDVCVEEAKGKQDVAQAELEYKQSGKTSDRDKVPLVRANADYAVAKEKCDDMAGADKDVCIKDAKSAQAKARATVKSAS